MRLSPFLDTQTIDHIQWSEPEAGTLAYRYPMLDKEIQSGARLAVGQSEMAVFVDQGRIADAFAPGVHALNVASLSLLAGMKNWSKGFESAFKTDVYFFSTRDEVDQKWGTSTPILLRDAVAGAMRLRSYGSYSYRIADVCNFFNRVCGMRESYFSYDLDDRLRKIIVARLEDFVSASGRSDLETNLTELSEAAMKWIKPVFSTLGLELIEFSIQAISLRNAREDFEGTTDCDSCGAAMRVDHDVLKCDYCHVVVASNPGDDAADGIADFEGHACPQCEVPLMQATIGNASLLYCTRCDGMLVATEEFESLIAAARALPGAAVPAEAAELRDTFDCPGCGRGMGVSFYGGHVAIDTCEDCGMNWLDHGELARIAHAPACEGEREPQGSGVYFNPSLSDTSAGLNIGA